MNGEWVLVILTWGDGEGFAGHRCTSLRLNTRAAAEQIARSLLGSDDRHIIVHDPPPPRQTVSLAQVSPQ